jgi:hypothetical protein
MEVRITAAPLPSNFRGTPQQLVEALLDRLVVEVDGSSFVIGGTMPTSNQGPWLKDGSQWWVWDEDTSTYVPLDVSASVSDQIFVGEGNWDYNAETGVYSLSPASSANPSPDPEEVQIWLRTSGSAVVDLLWYAGTSAGWVSKARELIGGAVQTIHLADGVVTTIKISNGAVTPEKVADNFPLSKLVRGTANQIIQVPANGGTPTWVDRTFVSEEQDLAANSIIKVEHGLGSVPNEYWAHLVCKENDQGWNADDEVLANITGDDKASALYADDTYVGLVTPDVLRWLVKGTAGVRGSMTASKWKVKFFWKRG